MAALVGAPISIGAATSLPSQSQLEYLISQTAPSLLRPLAFFVSWNGVLTLAYSGFPPALAALKQSINDTINLPTEYSGSKWPKTSLGALHDKARLTPQQLEALNAICREESAKLLQDSDDQAVLVDRLSVVFYECRCLERRMLEHTVPMQQEGQQGLGQQQLGGSPPALLDERQPEAAEQERVLGVVGEAEAPDYWFLASKDGSREGHYRSSYLGVTLVHDLVAFRDGAAAAAAAAATLAAPDVAGAGHRAFGSRLPDFVRAFRARVDSKLPGLYRWFTDSSLHCTVRSLMG